MVYVLEKAGSNRCALDASRREAFSQKPFADLIYDSHSKGQDYYIARVHCSESNENHGLVSYMCYDARQLCKYIFEMVISAEGRKIRIKNFKDPINNKNIIEINFFRLRFDNDTPLRAEFVGNHVSFLESTVFRSRLFNQEDALDALSVNFQFKNQEQVPYIKKKKFLDVFLLLIIVLLIGAITYSGLKLGKEKLLKKDFRISAHEKE